MSREKADFIIEYVKRCMSQVQLEQQEYIDRWKRQKEYIKCSKRALRVYDKINKIKKIKKG
jgi:hypothetical protein